ncbi:MAG TPA: DnaJ domain-containing protein [Planctomycetes bacterium]|nr:DnaJ domain-containing protein [Planctomycetota bacterium]
MERITADLEARKAACKVLGVSENADKNELKKAYRKASMKYHPDHNPDDADSAKKFVLAKCAYELLAEDKPCPQLLEEINTWEGVPDDEKYKLDNPWGHFLWWREKFFASEKEKKQSENRSCI